MISIGDEAPDFLARSTSEKAAWLRSLRGKPVVLHFLPGGMNVAAENEGFCARHRELSALGAEALGVWAGSREAWQKLAAKGGATLPPIINDELEQIARAYGVLRPALRVDQRVTFVIDEAGAVEAIIDREISPPEHVDRALRHLTTRAPLDHVTVPPRVTRAPGEVIADRYQLKRLLAQGGAGEVWSAEHTHLRQEVAIKLLREGSFGDLESAVNHLERFRQESQVAALLGRRTAHVVAVRDAGFSEVGPFLVMELVSGGTLQGEILAKGPMPPARALAVLEQVGEAVSVAHAAGVVHRDLKPSNVLLERGADGTVFVKVADFGLAKSTNAALKLDRPQHTVKTIVMGTVEFMSPEQVRGGEEADPRMDVWALGVIAYQMLTGTLPFQGSSKTSIIAKIIARPFDPIERVRPGLPKRLDRWFARALAKEREERFASVAAMLEALRRTLDESESERESERERTAVESAATVMMPAPETHAAPAGPERSPRPMLAALALTFAAVGAWVGASVTFPGSEEVQRLDTPAHVAVGGPVISAAASVVAGASVDTAARAAAPEQPSVEPPSTIPVASTSASASASPPKTTGSSQKRPEPADPSSIF